MVNAVPSEKKTKTAQKIKKEWHLEVGDNEPGQPRPRGKKMKSWKVGRGKVKETRSRCLAHGSWVNQKREKQCKTGNRTSNKQRCNCGATPRKRFRERKGVAPTR